MNIILKFADNLYKRQFKYNFRDIEETKYTVNSKLYEINEKIDKIQFLNYLLDKANFEYEKHLKVCRDIDNCPENFSYESLIYYFQQELISLDVKINENTFTEDEIQTAENKLDQIIVEIEKLKLGQQVIYDDLVDDIEELKNLYFLGKKNWYQLLGGKVLDMTVSGVISETASKEIIEIFKSGFKQIV